jgi:ArsR family transcriptional regulator, repressor of sdpIR and other operons
MNLVFKALADPTRRRVLELLRKGPMTAGELAGHFPVSKPTMSAHFAVLRQADLVDAKKSGKTITYLLKLSVLEHALLGFAGMFGVRAAGDARRRKNDFKREITPWPQDS